MSLKKIEYAVGAASLFVQHLHRENFDRGMIATFGNSFQMEQGFTFYEGNLHSSLGMIARSISNERTRLYDSIEDVINAFWSGGSRNRPWLLTIITDGQDNESRKYRNNPAGIGHFVATRFNHEASNYIFVIGVGEGAQIDRNALATLGNYGNFLAITIEAFPLLERVFLEIALRVTTQITGYQVNIGNLSWGEVARIRQVSHVAFDYAFLIDRSGSMSERG
jgi:hypothetical protein